VLAARHQDGLGKGTLDAACSTAISGLSETTVKQFTARFEVRHDLEGTIGSPSS